SPAALPAGTSSQHLSWAHPRKHPGQVRSAKHGMMGRVSDTAGRLLRLLPLLTARPNWRGDELAARLGVTTRTVRRDIDRLRELGYPVHAIPGRRGGYALGPGGTRLPPLLLDEDSAVAVALGLRAAAADPALRGSQEAAARAAAAIDQVKGEWGSFRLDRMEDVRPTGARSHPASPPDAARFVSEALSSGPYRWRARVLLDAPADVVAAMVPSTVAVVEAIGERRCLF